MGYWLKRRTLQIATVYIVCTDWIVEKVSDTSTSELMKAV